MKKTTMITIMTLVVLLYTIQVRTQEIIASKDIKSKYLRELQDKSLIKAGPGNVLLYTKGGITKYDSDLKELYEIKIEENSSSKVVFEYVKSSNKVVVVQSFEEGKDNYMKVLAYNGENGDLEKEIEHTYDRKTHINVEFSENKEFLVLREIKLQGNGYRDNSAPMKFSLFKSNDLKKLNENTFIPKKDDVFEGIEISNSGKLMLYLLFDDGFKVVFFEGGKEKVLQERITLRKKEVLSEYEYCDLGNGKALVVFQSRGKGIERLFVSELDYNKKEISGLFTFDFTDDILNAIYSNSYSTIKSKYPEQVLKPSIAKAPKYLSYMFYLRGMKVTEDKIILSYEYSLGGYPIERAQIGEFKTKDLINICLNKKGDYLWGNVIDKNALFKNAERDIDQILTPGFTSVLSAIDFDGGSIKVVNRENTGLYIYYVCVRKMDVNTGRMEFARLLYDKAYVPFNYNLVEWLDDDVVAIVNLKEEKLQLISVKE